MTTTLTGRAAQDLDLPGLTRELRRHADDVDRRRRPPIEGLAALGERGVMGSLIPRAYGGLELSPAELFAVGAAIGAGCGATGLIWGQHLAATAFVARWGNDAARELLPAAARGERLFGIGVGYAGRENAPVQARREHGRVIFSGEATWVTGAALMTDGLLSAQDKEQGGVLMAVIPRAAVKVLEPYQMAVVTSGMNCSVAIPDVDVTDWLLATPRERTATGAVFTQNKSPRDAGFHAGLTSAALELCRSARTMDASLTVHLDRMDQAADEVRTAMLDWLDGRNYEEIDTPPFWERYQPIAQVMWEAAGLVMSAGGSGGLFDGATHNRLAREAMYYLARVPLRTRLPYVAGT